MSAHRWPALAIGGGAVVLVVVLAVVLAAGGGGNALASSYTCNTQGGSLTINFTSTGTSATVGGGTVEVSGIAGDVTDGGGTVESFFDGSFERGQVNFGQVTNGVNGPIDLTDGGTIENGDLSLNGGVVCSP